MSLTADPRRNANEDFYLGEDPHKLVHLGIVRFIQQHGGPKLLDLGCGLGGYAHHLIRRGHEVTAVDRNPRYVELARRYGVPAQLVEGERLPFADGAFDAVFLVEVLEHIPDGAVPAVLREARRVAKRSVILTVPDCTDHARLTDQGFMHSHFACVDHVQFFTAENLPALLRQHFPRVEVTRADPIYPHRLLAPWIRRPLSLLYRLKLLRPDFATRLYAAAYCHA
jgi:SAM-dependent methyltransferase